MKLSKWIMGGNVDVCFQGAGFWAYRMERASEPKGSRAEVWVWGKVLSTKELDLRQMSSITCCLKKAGEQDRQAHAWLFTPDYFPFCVWGRVFVFLSRLLLTD